MLTQLGKYLLVERIARGGMAEIFLAKLHGAEGFEKEIVIKRILPEWSANKDFLSMLIDEAKLAVLLTHANIVQVHELGREGDDTFIAMEYVKGVDLRRLWDKVRELKKTIPLPLILYIILQALEGLGYAHRKKDPQGQDLKIIHRDISPQNLLISFDGAVKITDFGIAKATLSTTETASGVHKGKFSYMSPEQANLQQVDQTSDLFSLGIVFFELVTGRRLFGGGSDIETLDKIRRAEVSFTQADLPNIQPPLQKILLKALAKDRKDRFRTAQEFREELFQFASRSGQLAGREDLASFLEEIFPQEISHPQRTETRRTPPAIKSPARNNRKLIMTAGLSILFVISVALFFLFRSRPIRQAASPAPAAPAEVLITQTENAAETPALLSVMAIPWGFVSIDGGSRLESPLRNKRMKAGLHEVEVYYEPSQTSLRSQVDLRPGMHIRCLANFGEKERKLRCHSV